MPTYPKPTEGFNPGSADDLGYIRTIDGHRPWSGGDEGANKHMGGDFGTFGDDDRVGLPVEDC